MPGVDNETMIRIDPHKRQKSKTQRNTQYFRFQDRERERQAWILLERENLTTEEIIQFCNASEDFLLEETDAQQLAYRTRRQELQRLLEALPSGGAFVDRHGRLVPADENGPPLPPLPALNPNNHQNNDDNNHRNVGAAGNLPRPPRNNNNPHDDDVPLVHQEAEAAIARAVERYRQQGVPDDDLQLIRLEVFDNVEPPMNPLTMRRILIAVAAVVLAYVSMLIQTLAGPTTAVFLEVDPLPAVILKQRNIVEHIRECDCPTNRSRSVLSTPSWLLQAPKSDCGDGVLIIPSIDYPLLFGINASWWFKCDPEPSSDVCVEKQACFRGVHDAIMTDDDVSRAIRFGKYMIDLGKDHFDIHTEVSLLQAMVPNIVAKLELLLKKTYNIHTATPVAFRVHAAGPISGDGVRGSHLSSLLNLANYRSWTDHAARRNRLAGHFPIPWPFTIFKPVRDTCNLMADRQVDERFQIHTSVMLSDDSSDGMFLFADEIQDMVTRGLAIEGEVGRVVISTTGNENRRCRLPIRSGIRAALQIWWTLPE